MPPLKKEKSVLVYHIFRYEKIKNKYKKPFYEKVVFRRKNIRKKWILYVIFYWIFDYNNVSFLIAKISGGVLLLKKVITELAPNRFAQDSIISLEILHKQHGGWNETFN